MHLFYTSEYFHGIFVAQFTPDLLRGKHFIFLLLIKLQHPVLLHLFTF